MTIYGYRVPMVASIVVWCVIWEIVGRFELLLLFPPFTEVLWALGDVVTSRSFAGAAALTLYAYAWGLGLCRLGRFRLRAERRDLEPELIPTITRHARPASRASIPSA